MVSSTPSSLLLCCVPGSPVHSPSLAPFLFSCCADMTTNSCGLGAWRLSGFAPCSLPWHLTHSCGPHIAVSSIVGSLLPYLLLDMSSSKMLPGGLVDISDLMVSELELLVCSPTCLPSSSPLQVMGPPTSQRCRNPLSPHSPHLARQHALGAPSLEFAQKQSRSSLTAPTPGQALSISHWIATRFPFVLVQPGTLADPLET